MIRKPFRSWLVPLLLGPACALALDIGEIQVHSALNQLFDARIPLPALAPEELDKISVKLAPASMFKEFQLERASALTTLVFSIEYNAEGQVYVKVISTKPIQEPSLGLLVEFGWPRGKTFREFTVFLDPVQRLTQRPSDRSKTVLTVPATVPAPPVEAAPSPEPAPTTVAATPMELASRSEPAPATVAATPEPEPSAQPGDDRESESRPAMATVTAEAIGAPDQPPFPVEAPPPAKVYRPNDTYGPVAPGEGLWGIALKVRPDPGITREEMTQALFQTNPHAFGKAGIAGLKAGATLRIPSFQEIAEITGSAAARHLAGLEQPATPAVAAAPSPSLASAATPSPTATVAPTIPEVFPLELPAPLEPIMVEAAPTVPAPETRPAIPTPESATSPSDPVAVESESIPAVYELATMIPMPLALFEPIAVASWPPTLPPEASPPISTPEPATPPSEPVAAETTQPLSTPEPAMSPSEPVAIESEFAPADPVSSATTSELAGSTTAPVVAVESEPVAQLGAVVEESMPVAPELVSVTPLLFLAVSEMVAAIAQPPAVTVPETPTMTPEPKDLAMSEPPAVAADETPAPAPTTLPELTATPMATIEPPAVAADETPAPASTTLPEPSAMPMDTANLLAVVEKYLPHLNQDLPWHTYLTSDVPVPRATTLAESLPDPTPLTEATSAPAAEVEEVSAPTAADARLESTPIPVSSSVEEVSAPTAADAPQAVAAGPAESPPKVAETPPPQRQDSHSYGPVASNERLWDIAAKVRPDPVISKPHMMKALLKANPQAFSKPNNMDSLKVGATLRIPTLREIVETTDSKAARQLLEQQEIAVTSSPPAPEPEFPSPALAAETAPAPEAVAPTPEPAPAVAIPPASEPPAPVPAAESPSAPRATEPSALAAESPSTPEPAPSPTPAPASETPPIPEPPGPEPAPIAPEPVPEPPVLEAAPAAEPPPVSELPASEPASPPEPAAESPSAPEPSAPTTEAPAISEPPLPAPVGEKEVSE